MTLLFKPVSLPTLPFLSGEFFLRFFCTFHFVTLNPYWVCSAFILEFVATRMRLSLFCTCSSNMLKLCKATSKRTLCCRVWNHHVFNIGYGPCSVAYALPHTHFFMCSAWRMVHPSSGLIDLFIIICNYIDTHHPLCAVEYRQAFQGCPNPSRAYKGDPQRCLRSTHH